MRLTVNRESLIKSLSIASRAVPAKSPILTMTSLKLELNEKGLEVTGANGELTIRSTVPYKTGEKEIIKSYDYGSFLVNARMFLEIVRKLDDEEITLEVIDNAILKIKANRLDSELKCQNGDEFVDVDLEASGTTFEIASSELTTLIEQTAFAASNKDLRPILKSVHLEAENGSLVAVATDSARLARKAVSVDEDARFACNINAKTALDVVHMLDNVPTVRVSISLNKALFEFERVSIATRLSQGDYPLTRSIIPTSFNDTLEVSSSELLKAIDIVKTVCPPGEPVVRLSMEEDKVEVSARGESNQPTRMAVETCRYTGDPLRVSFNSQFVIDAVKALKGSERDDVNVCFLGEMKPFVIKNPKDDSVVFLITPMRTN